MITFHTGDIFDLPADVRINTVNCVGVMGKGIALAFKQRYPQMFNAYRTACRQGEVQVGKLWIYKADNFTVVNFPTKQHWRDPSRLEWIAEGLRQLRMAIGDLYLNHYISIPALGCQNGGLDWNVVKPMIVHAMTDVGANIQIFEPLQNH